MFIKEGELGFALLLDFIFGVGGGTGGGIGIATAVRLSEPLRTLTLHGAHFDVALFLNVDEEKNKRMMKSMKRLRLVVVYSVDVVIIVIG